MLQFWSKRHQNFFYVNFRPFLVDSYGVEQNSSFLATFFSSACNFGRNANRPKLLAGQISKYTRDYPKHFHASGTNIGGFIWGPWGGGGTRVFPPLQIPIPISFKSAQGWCLKKKKLLILYICRKIKYLVRINYNFFWWIDT